jgi:hypothetical protein
MTKKLFISYSHKDESYREALEEHLSMLKRKNTISVWHDRKILAGEEWKDQIDDNLEAADIIIFLISSSFLASNYCFDVEVKKAMEKHAAGTARIISVIVRPCDWHECEFSRFQAVPKGALPISKWTNEDSAWLDAVTGLKRHINEFTPSSQNNNIVEIQKKIQLSTEFSAWLDDTEIVLAHRKVDKVNLSDIYVSLDIEFDDSKKKETKIISAEALSTKQGYYLAYGEEQQGKTTLLKHAFVEFLKKEYLPIYIDAKAVKNSDLQKLLQKLIEEQYAGMSFEQYQALDKKVLLIDNLDNVELNTKYRNIFIQQVTESFNWVIITCHSSYNYVSHEAGDLSLFKESKLLGFGNAKREEIVRKWITLGVEETIEEAELYTKCDELKTQLNTVIKKNIVPTKPIYILMLMQIFEAYTQKNLELTSYGHCYQQLIYQSFEKAKIKSTEYEKYLNVLTELSWARFKQNRGLNQYQLDTFFVQYGGDFLSVNGSEIIEKLTHHSLLAYKDNLIDFKYPYIYYFFVGKKIAEGFAESDEIKQEVENLLDKLHREDFANILIFITHHTKDSWVLSKIKQVLATLFEGQEKATLARNQLTFMDDFIKKIPELVVEQREVQSERDEHNKKLDEIERVEDAANDEPVDILAKINKTFRGMELAGQIIRNRHASMKRDALYELADSGTSSGLRFLDYFIKISDEFKLELIKFIELQLIDHPSLTNREIQILAEDTYLQLTYGVINGVIRKIAASIGSKEASEIYAALEGNENTPAYILIKLAIELQFTRVLNITTIEQTLEKLKNNAVCSRILKEIVIQHIYMFPVEYQIKQKLSELLNITVMGQRLMDQKMAKKA